MCVSYRPQLWHIPAKVIRSMHHLSNDAIHLLHQQTTRTDRESKHWGATVIYLVLTITLLVQLLTELSRTPLPSLSYSLKATEKKEKKLWMNNPSYRGVTEYCSVVLQQRGNPVRTYTPACLWAGHPPKERSNTKRPWERPLLRERMLGSIYIQHTHMSCCELWYCRYLSEDMAV